MKMLQIPELNRAVSRLGMGSMIFSPEQKERTFRLLDRFREHGGNLIDTAEVYGGGKSELAIGMYLAERKCRADWVILDKAAADRPQVRPDYIRKAIQGNLERLGTDYIDLWVLHRDNPAVPVAELVDVLNEQRERGYIRAFGGSNWTPARLAEANAYAKRNGKMGLCLSSPNVCLAIPNEPFWADCTHATDEDLNWHAKTRLPLFAWSSQGRGFFLDGSAPENTGNADLVRVYHNADNFRRLDRARKLAAAKGVQPIQIALAYVLNLVAPTVALVGPASDAEVDSCVAASNLEFTPEEVAWLRLESDRAPASLRDVA